MQKGFPALLLLFLWMIHPAPIAAQEASSASQTPAPAAALTELTASPSPITEGISVPLPGADLNGVVSVSGIAPAAWELSFAYADDPTGTWFPLAVSSSPVSGEFISWDTTLVTDGFYTLRLRVFSADGTREYMVNCRIRNYSPLETATPLPSPTLTSTATPPPATVTPTLTPTITFTPAPSPTPMPANPAILNPQSIGLRAGQGALLAAAVFLVLGALLAISQKFRA